MKRVSGWAWGVVALALVGCGGSDESDPAQCSNIAGCGGDVVGQWTIQSTCLTPTLSSMNSCEGMTADASGVKTTGTITFKSDKTFTSSFAQSGSMVVNVPASCLMRNGATVSCTQLQQGLQGSAADPSVTSVSCAAANGGCACTLVMAPQNSSNSGSYETSGSVLTEVKSDGSSEENAYCVKGGTLTLSPTSSSGESGSITLTKG